MWIWKYIAICLEKWNIIIKRQFSTYVFSKFLQFMPPSNIIYKKCILQISIVVFYPKEVRMGHFKIWHFFVTLKNWLIQKLFIISSPKIAFNTPVNFQINPFNLRDVVFIFNVLLIILKVLDALEYFFNAFSYSWIFINYFNY